MAEPAPPRNDLPVPYASPWGQLGQALRAVLATLRLKARELWRRNAEADLSVPGFWPQRLAPLFWPLLLAALLVLLAVPVLTWRGLSPPRGSAVPGPAAPVAAPAPIEPAALAPPTAPMPPLSTAPAAPVPGPEPEPPPLELDPLLALLADDDPEHLIASAHPEPAEARLVLTMAPAYADQEEPSRRRWAERWQQRALALGYGRLELVDDQQRLLARGALVGSGMILLDPGGAL
jgi:hypothetical protein